MNNEKMLEAQFNNVVIKVVDNKYRKVTTESGLILNTGLAFTQETGQIEKVVEEIIALAVVINTGPECKYYKVGDEVYLDTRSVRPIPFRGLEFAAINEQGIICKVS